MDERIRQRRIAFNHHLDSQGLTFEAGIPVETADEPGRIVEHEVPGSREIAAYLSLLSGPSEVDIQTILQAKGQTGLTFSAQTDFKVDQTK